MKLFSYKERIKKKTLLLLSYQFQKVQRKKKEETLTKTRLVDGCDFTSFSTVFRSYQDDGRMIMKACEQ